VRVQVARARPQDVGRGVARVSPELLVELGLEEGDAIEIIGQQRTAAIALRLPFDDRGLELLRIDGFQRTSAGVGIGEHAAVRPAAVQDARRVRFAPLDPETAPDAGAADALRATLMHRVLIAGDVVTTSIHHAGVSDGEGNGAGRPGTVAPPAFGLHESRLRVASTEPDGIVRIADATVIELVSGDTGSPAASGARGDVTYDDLGGMDDAVRQVREMIELPLKHPELFCRLGIDAPKGVLLHGPPGTGKTLLARALANEADARFFYVGGPEVMGSLQGESEERLREIFQRAREQAPAIVFLDEIDSIAPKRSEVRGDTERRLVAQLLTLMDGLEPRRSVVVMGATNLVDAIDDALRRPGRFDREIAVGAPDRAGRREILGIHTRGMPVTGDVDLDALARRTHGFVGADLAALAREAAIEALRRTVGGAELGPEEVRPAVLAGIEVTASDFEGAMRRVQPSAMRELVVQSPEVRWEDVGGLDAVVQSLREGIELPLARPEVFRRLGIRPARGFLLFGPPGTGKTLLAKAVAHEAEANFIGVKASALLSKWFGESERQIARLFARARQVAPAVIFLDEIDALAPQRGGGDESLAGERVVNTLLAEMDGLEPLTGVVVIGATNRPTLMDPALLRPGRFDELLYVPVPDRPGRLRILQVHTAGVPLAGDVDLAALAGRTHGYTGADLEGLVRRAGLLAFRRDAEARTVEAGDVAAALAASHPSVTPEMEQDYEAMLRELKQEWPRGGRRIGFRVDGDAAGPVRGTPGPGAGDGAGAPETR
jgi:transitional endoplasmic reticulum ATPase